MTGGCKKNFNNFYNNNDYYDKCCLVQYYNTVIGASEWSCQNSQKLQNVVKSSHYPTTTFALCIYFLQDETPLFRIHEFRTRRLIHTPSLSWLQSLNFEFVALRREKRRGLAFYAGTSCLSPIHSCEIRTSTCKHTKFK